MTEAVAKYGDKNWDQVATCLDRRTGQQCMFRWEKTLCPTIKHGRWDADEDAVRVPFVRQSNWGMSR